MIVIAIIGILAAIAVPNFMSAQYRAKRAELPGAVSSIKIAELAYAAAYDEFVDAPLMPRSDVELDKTQAEWDRVAARQFTEIGWAPDGMVRGNYQVTGASETDFLAEGHCDVDDDDHLFIMTASHNVGVSTAVGDEWVF